MDFNIARTSGQTPETIMSVGYAGNVGIGTTTPDGTLHVKDTIGQVYIQSDDGQPAAIVFGDATDASRGGVEYTTTDDIVFKNNNMAEQMRIRYTGNVGIGNPNPTEKLEVAGSIVCSNFTDEEGIFFRSGFSNSNKYNVSIMAKDHNGNAADGLSINGYDGISFCTGSNSRNEVVRIQGGTSGAGNVGIGTDSPLYKLDVRGNSTGINISGTSSFLRFNSGDNQIRVGSGYKMHFDVYDGSSLATILDIDTSGILVSEGQREVKKRVPLFTGANAGSYSTSTNLAYTKSSDNRPTTYDSLKAVVRARAYTKYIHVKTNLLSDNIMFYFRVEGYQYNYGVNKAVRGGYTYSNTVITEAVKVAYNSNASFTIGDFYRSTTGGTTGFLCMRIDVHQTGYTEGELGIFFGSHSSTVQDSLQITDMQHRDDGNAAY